MNASSLPATLAPATAEPTAVQQRCAYRFPPWMLGFFVLLALLVYAGFARAIQFMIGQWSLDEFSHGYLIPFIAGFLVWQRREALKALPFTGSRAGVTVVLVGLGLGAAGRLASLYAIQHIGLWVVIVGLALSLGGWRVLRVLGPPLGVLIFMIPLPDIVLTTLSAKLQLISSSLGVALIRLAGVAVLLQGNVIDLGSYKLEVAEACSGLRYLLPLMTLAFLMACFYREPLWKRLLLFLSSIPLTLLTNSLRIAAIGVAVDRWGPGMAEGLVHQVQGWMMFMMSTAVLVLEAVLLSRRGDRRRSWREVFGLEVPLPTPSNVPRRARSLPAPLLTAAAAVLLFSTLALAAPERTGPVLARESFATFPLTLGNWAGRRETLDQSYLDVLKLDDYLLADYIGGAGRRPVNLYVAWYDSQRAGEATHSPKACLPGGGWQIEDLRRVSLTGVTAAGQPLRVNRALIRDGEQRQLVYYWFQQRGRVFTNEYLLKWYLLRDALVKRRTDGALVRLIAPLSAAESERDADRALQVFAAAMTPRLSRYVPN